MPPEMRETGISRSGNQGFPDGVLTIILPKYKGGVDRKKLIAILIMGIVVLVSQPVAA
jgi:hypothetical protein